MIVLRSFAVLALLVFVSGCSAIKLAYNNADDLSYWWLDGYLDFRDEQVADVRTALAELHRWHRKNELPEYLRLLARMQQLAAGEVSANQACELLDEASGRVRATLDQAAVPVARLAPKFDAAQLGHLQQRYGERNREWRADWIDTAPEKRDRKRLERLQENVERFYGALREPQIALLRELVATTPFEAELIFREIRRRQADNLALLQRLRNAAADEALERMRELLQGWRQPSDIEYQRYIDSIQTRSCAVLARMHNTITPEQRQQLQNRLRNYVDDLTALAAQAG